MCLHVFDTTLTPRWKLIKANTHTVKTCHYSNIVLQKKKTGILLTKTVKTLQEVEEWHLPISSRGLFGSYDTFTYLPEQESFSFTSAHALQRISKIHLYPSEVPLPGDMLLGRRTELIWYTEFRVNSRNPLYASCLVSSAGAGCREKMLFFKATAAGLPIVVI